MRRRWMTAGVWILALAVLGGPVAAGDFTGTEKEEQELACPGPGESVPENQEPPGPDDCGEGEETYHGYVWTNNVKCNDDGIDAQAGQVYATGSESDMEGGVGACNDQDTGPIKGRAVVYGSMDDGLSVYADGTEDNQPDQAQGWIRIDVNSGGPTVRCGAEDGKRDATNPGENDTQDNCG